MRNAKINDGFGQFHMGGMLKQAVKIVWAHGRIVDDKKKSQIMKI